MLLLLVCYADVLFEKVYIDENLATGGKALDFAFLAPCANGVYGDSSIFVL